MRNKYGYFENKNHLLRYMKKVLKNFLKKRYGQFLTDFEQREVFNKTIDYVFDSSIINLDPEKNCKNYVVTAIRHRATYEVKRLVINKNNLGTFNSRHLDSIIKKYSESHVHEVIKDESIYDMDRYLDLKGYANTIKYIVNEWNKGKMTKYDKKVREDVRDEVRRKNKGTLRSLPHKKIAPKVLKMYSRILQQIIQTDHGGKLACLQKELNTSRQTIFEAKKRMYEHLNRMDFVKEAIKYLQEK
jgi:hypothetical protein